MNDELKIKMYSFTLDCVDPSHLAGFYAALLKWEIVFAVEDYAAVAPPGSKQGSYPGILFQRNPDYVSPVWPATHGSQQLIAHIDFAVNDFESTISHAIDCGAIVAETQFSADWTVMIDPAGHPFCLCLMRSMMESTDFSLL